MIAIIRQPMRIIPLLCLSSCVSFLPVQINLNSTLLEAEVLPYVVGQRVLDGVFGILRAVIKNYTGIDLNF